MSAPQLQPLQPWPSDEKEYNPSLTQRWVANIRRRALRLATKAEIAKALAPLKVK